MVCGVVFGVAVGERVVELDGGGFMRNDGSGGRSRVGTGDCGEEWGSVVGRG